uniref:Tropomyosin 2 n=1 Tax=Nematostella vectensis TaxID=45351 RepID=Q0ZDM0_NEMVE|nr:tropomyosin 2 [Nematostella vectensis]
MAQLLKLKEKMQQIKDQTDDAEERELGAKSLLKEAEAKEEQLLSEASGIQRRITLLNSELEKKNERVEEQEKLLQNLVHNSEMNEEARKGLEESEMKGDEKIMDLEAKLKEMERVEKETLETLTEAERKEVVVTRDLERAIEKGRTLENRIQSLESTMGNALTNIQKLEASGDEAYEREELKEEKLKFFQEQLKQYEQRYEDAEREALKLERINDTIIIEIDSYKKKKEEILREMDLELVDLNRNLDM